MNEPVAVDGSLEAAPVDVWAGLTREQKEAAFTAANKRLHALKLWDRYEELRSEYKSQGMAREEAQLAAIRFLPHDFKSMAAAEFPIHGLPIPPAKGKKSVTSTAVATMAKVPPRQARAIAVAKAISDDAREKHALNLLVLAVPDDRVADANEIARWVVNHLKVSLENVDADHVPDRTALVLLEQCRAEPGFCRNFLTKYMEKLLPSKQQTDEDRALADDGREQLALVERTLVAVQQEADE